MWRWEKNNLVIIKNGKFVEKKSSFIYLFIFYQKEVVLVLDD